MVECTLCIKIEGTNTVECFVFPRRLRNGEIVYMCSPSPYASITFRDMSKEEFEKFKKWYDSETSKV